MTSADHSSGHARGHRIKTTALRALPCLLAVALASCASDAATTPSASASLTSTALAVDADTFLDSYSTQSMNMPFGTVSYFVLDSAAIPVLRVDPEAIRSTPNIHRLVRATLRFQPFDGFASNATVSVHAMEQEWEEGAATWNCPEDTMPTNYTPECNPGPWHLDHADPEQRPDAAAATDTVTLADVPAWVEFDVTADVMRIIDGAPGHGWSVRLDSGSLYLYVVSREGGILNPPELKIETEDDSFIPTACPAPDLSHTRISRVADVVDHV